MRNTSFQFSCIVLALLCAYSIWRASAQAVQQPRNFPSALSGSLPYDVDIPTVRRLVEQNNITAAHAEFDILAWQAFIALNWPARPNGQPSTTLTIADTAARRVWDFRHTPNTIFLRTLPRGPISREIPSHFMWRSAWRQHTTAARSLEAFSGPLVDQNGNWVRYQIRVNREEFAYILSNHLYSQDGQADFSRKELKQVDLPANAGTTTHGAIEIKLAWKQLGQNEDASRFFTQELTADVSEAPAPLANRCRRRCSGGTGRHAYFYENGVLAGVDLGYIRTCIMCA